MNKVSFSLKKMRRSLFLDWLETDLINSKKNRLPQKGSLFVISFK